MSGISKALIMAGLLLLLAGLILHFSGGKLNWLGKLPGDFSYKSDRVSFYFPLTTMLLLSAIISILLWLIRKMS